MKISMNKFSVKSIALFVFVCMLFAGFAACDGKSKKYEQAVSSGDSALAANDYEEAISYYEHAKSIKPGEEYPGQQIEKARELQQSWEKQRKFDQGLKDGDKYFNQGNYQQAIEAYYSALQVNPHNNYALEQIEKAEANIAEEEKQKEAGKNPYHIVVGSFENEEYAGQMQQKLIESGYDSKLIPRRDGYTAVSLYSYPDLNTAWNNLNSVLNMERFYDVDPWIVKYSENRN